MIEMQRNKLHQALVTQPTLTADFSVSMHVVDNKKHVKHQPSYPLKFKEKKH